MVDMKRILITSILLCGLNFAQENKKTLQINLYDVWTIEEVGLRMLIIDAVDYFIDANPSDSVAQIKPYDQLIVIVSKKVGGEIFQFRYGNRGKYIILNDDQVKWMFSKKLRSEILNKQYHLINDKTFIMNINTSLEKEYLGNDTYWTNRDIFISTGSKVLADKLILRFTSIGGVELTPLFALSIKTGNNLLGFPSHSLGNIDIGLLNRNFELGIKTPLFSSTKSQSILVGSSSDTSRYLQGGFGGYGKISFFGMRSEFSFSELLDNKLVKDFITDSVNIDLIGLSFTTVPVNFGFNIYNLGYIHLSAGGSYYKVAHRSLLEDGSIVERLINRAGESLENPESSFMGPVIRLDFISKMNNESSDFPYLQLFTQVNAYKNATSFMFGGGINYKRVGLDLTYKQTLDDIDWAPKSEMYWSFNYFFDQSEN